MHSLVDDYSRLAYSEVLPDEKGTTCAGFLRRAANYFAEHGITPIERIMTDNAWAYRCTSNTERQRLGHLYQPGRAPSTTLRAGCNTFQSDR